MRHSAANNRYDLSHKSIVHTPKLATKKRKIWQVKRKSVKRASKAYILRPKRKSKQVCIWTTMVYLKHVTYGPQWCISSMLHMDHNGVSQACYIWTTMVYLKHVTNGPQWCISSMLHSRDTPFWSGTLDFQELLSSH